MTEEDKNINFLLTKVRELEEKVKSKESIITYNGVDVRYVDDKTLQSFLNEEKIRLQSYNTQHLNTYIYGELLKRERAGVKIIKG